MLCVYWIRKKFLTNAILISGQYTHPKSVSPPDSFGHTKTVPPSASCNANHMPSTFLELYEIAAEFHNTEKLSVLYRSLKQIAVPQKPQKKVDWAETILGKPRYAFTISFAVSLPTILAPKAIILALLCCFTSLAVTGSEHTALSAYVLRIILCIWNTTAWRLQSGRRNSGRMKKYRKCTGSLFKVEKWRHFWNFTR